MLAQRNFLSFHHAQFPSRLRVFQPDQHDKLNRGLEHLSPMMKESSFLLDRFAADETHAKILLVDNFMEQTSLKSQTRFGQDKLLSETVVLTRLDKAVGWARKYSLFPYPFATACCAMEYMSLSMSPYDIDRFGALLPRFSPRQADLLMVIGSG